MKPATWISTFVVLMIGSLPVAFGADTSPAIEHGKMAAMHAGKELTPEMRAKMAEMHQMMADCIPTCQHS